MGLPARAVAGADRPAAGRAPRRSGASSRPRSKSQASICPSSSVSGSIVSSRRLGASQTSTRPGPVQVLVKVAWMAPPSRRSPVTCGDPARQPLGRRTRLPQVVDVGVVDVLDADGPALLVECAHRAGDPHGWVLLVALGRPRCAGHRGGSATAPGSRRATRRPRRAARGATGRSAAGLGLHVDEPGLAEHPQVPRDPGSGDGQRLGQLAGRGRMVAKDLQNGAPALVGQCVQDHVHAGECTHSVTYRQGYESKDRRKGYRSPDRGPTENPSPCLTSLEGEPQCCGPF